MENYKMIGPQEAVVDAHRDARPPTKMTEDPNE